MTDFLNDNVITIFAKTLWDRNVDPNNDDDWYWDGYAESWKEQRKEYARRSIKDLNIKFLKKWVEKGIHSDELIAKTVLLAYDAKCYGQKQRTLINQITDPVMKKGVIEAMKDV